MKILWSFGSLLYDLLGCTRSADSLRLIFLFTGAKTSCVFYSMFHKLWDYPLWLVGTENIIILLWIPTSFPSNPFRWFFPWPWAIFSHAYTQEYSGEPLGETLCNSFQFSLFPIHFCSVFLPAYSSLLGFPKFPFSSWILLDPVIFFVLCGKKLFMTVCWDNHRAHLNCFSFQGSLRFVVWYWISWKSLLHIFYLVFSFFFFSIL